MSKIVRIPPHIISRIAAGEVIERPVYAIKELVENSLDANASRITIQVEQGGLKRIIVTDDGDGMDSSDLHESFKPHTTSKLVEDSLTGIQTLGFRGEALASIAAVSDMIVQSRTRESSAGVHVTIKAGNVTKSGPIGMPFGTSVTVENLFYTVPARKKFLKSERTEFRHIINLISKYALSYPAIRFLLIHNSRVILDLPVNQTTEERLTLLLKTSMSLQLLPIQGDDPYITINGYIGHPQLSANTINKQYIFINNRTVTDRHISIAVKDAYGSLIEKSRYPVFVLSLTVPFEVVDVNVHPRKEQVSFINQDYIVSSIRSLVSETLARQNLTHSASITKQYSRRGGTTKLSGAQLLREQEPLWNVKDPLSLIDSTSVQQIHNTYIVVQTKNGVLMIDQHAAHERILYEQLFGSYTKKVRESYVLNSPISLDLTVEEKEVLLEFHQIFENFGFVVKEEKNEILLYALPKLFKDRDPLLLIRELVEDLEEKQNITGIDTISQLMIEYLACRGAIKAGERLTDKEAKRLLEKLEVTPNNSSCPHGRPTRIEFSLRELHKWFKRE